MNLNDSTAMVTGGARRIGRGIVKALRGAGCRVVIHYRSSGKEAEELARELGSDSTFVVQGDLSSERGCVDVFARAVNECGPVNILVNNASVYHRDPLQQTTLDRMTGELDPNLSAPVILCREFAAQSFDADSKSPCASVVNLLDTRISGHEPGCLAYLVSKKALAAATLDLAVELAPLIRVNGVAPGNILEPSLVNISPSAGKALPLTPYKCSVEDVAEAVVFTAKADYLTGQILYVDSGGHLNAGER